MFGARSGFPSASSGQAAAVASLWRAKGFRVSVFRERDIYEWQGSAVESVYYPYGSLDPRTKSDIFQIGNWQSQIENC